MNLLTDILLAPITAPSKGLIYVFNKVMDQADEEFNDPARVRADLLALGQLLDAGQLTEEQYERGEAALLARLDAIEERRNPTEPAEAEVTVVHRSTRRRRRR
ncbi:MAG: gas vesicle protein GvpG [Actinomycetes bacterium]